VVNSGKESAFNVKTTCEVAGQILTSETRKGLGVQENFKQVFSSGLKLERPGRYPAIVTGAYTDSNQYPFSAISIQSFVYQEETAPKILGILKGVEFSSKRSTELIVKNLDSHPKTIQLQFLLPKELSSSDLIRRISLEPNSETKVTLGLKNFSALPGSTYPIYALLEYALEERHYSVTAVGTAKIVEMDFMKENKNLLFGISIFLGSVFILMNVEIFINLLKHKIRSI